MEGFVRIIPRKPITSCSPIKGLQKKGNQYLTGISHTKNCEFQNIRHIILALYNVKHHLNSPAINTCFDNIN